jgi:hypothetical protein
LEAYAPVSAPTVPDSDPVQSYQSGSRCRFPCQGHSHDTDEDMSIILSEEREAIKIGFNGMDYPGKS